MLTHRDLIVTMNTIVVTGVLRVYVTQLRYVLCLYPKGSRHVSRLDLHTTRSSRQTYYPEFYTTNSE